MATQVPHGENRDDLRRVAGNAFPLLLYVALRHLKGSTQGCVLTHLAVVKASVLKAGAVAPGHCPKAREDLTVFPDKVWSGSEHCPQLSEASPEHCELQVLFYFIIRIPRFSGIFFSSLSSFGHAMQLAGYYFPDQQLNPYPSHWQCRVFTLRHQGNPTGKILNEFSISGQLWRRRLNSLPFPFSVLSPRLLGQELPQDHSSVNVTCKVAHASGKELVGKEGGIRKKKDNFFFFF